MADVCQDGQETHVKSVNMDTMVPTVTDVVQTALYLEVVIEQVGSVMEAVNVDGVDPFVIKCAITDTLDMNAIENVDTVYKPITAITSTEVA